MPQGPFSQYLTETFKPQTPQPTGFETTPVAIAAIGSKFLDGLRQSRLQKAAMAERDNEKVQRGYEQALAFLDKQEGVDPAIKQQHLNQISQAYLGHIAGQKETSRDTGHPMTDMVKNVAMNLIGGNLPKKGAPLDQGLIGQAFVAMNDPANRTDNLLARLNSDYATAVKTGNINDIRTATAQENYPRTVAEGRRLSGKPDWQPDIFLSLAADPLEHNQKQLRMGVFNDPAIRAMMPGSAATSQPPSGTTQSPQPGASDPVASSANAATQTATPPGMQAPTATASGGRNLFLDIAASAKKSQLLKFAGAPDFSNTPTPGKPESVVDSQGNRHNARNLPTDWNGYPAGYYADSGAHLPGAQLANRVDPDKPKPLTPERIATLSVEFKTGLRKALKDPTLIQAAEAAIDSNLTSNDLKGAGDVLTRYMQMQQTQDSTEAARAIASSNHAVAAGNRADARSLQGMQAATALAQNFLASEEAKGMHAADRVAANTNKAYAAIRAGGDPGIYQLEMLRNWAKATDIMTGVKEGEYQSLQEAIGRLRSAGIAINNILDATGKRIDPKMEKAVVDSINRIRDVQYGLFEKKRLLYESQLKQSGFSASPLLSNTYAAPGNSSEPDQPKPKVNYKDSTPGFRPDSSAPIPTEKKKIAVKPI